MRPLAEASSLNGDRALARQSPRESLCLDLYMSRS